MQKNNVVEFKNLTKKFGDLIANDSINFEVRKNEIHALLGENGAGKSTLMSILFGLYKPTSGDIKINGKVARIKSPRHANELKIAMLPQHFKLVENMTVLENIMLGYELTSYGIVNKSAARHKIDIAKDKYNIKIDLNAIVGKLSVSDKQKVELLKILWGEADILIFDEPTSILTPDEVIQFLKLLKDLKKAKKTILLITHKLNEIREVADRVSIIRKGKYIKTVSANTSEKELANLMVGREVDLNLGSINRIPVNNELTVLEVSDVTYKSSGFGKDVSQMSFNIKSGEILGIAAIEGNGQSELLKIVGGIYKPTSGTLKITGHDITNKSTKYHYYTKDEYTLTDSVLRVKKIHQKFLSSHDNEIREINKYDKEKQYKISDSAVIDYSEMAYYWAKNSSLLSHIPEDRHRHGLVLDYSVTKNVVLQDLKYYSNRYGILSTKSMRKRLDYIKEKYDVRGIQDYKTAARKLSGGNQQKLILGREIERGSNVLIAVHPTRGLDVGAIRNVYENIIETRNQGSAVLLSSGELDEVMQVSDRIMVIYEGKIVSLTNRGELSKLQLGSLMSTGSLNGSKKSVALSSKSKSNDIVKEKSKTKLPESSAKKNDANKSPARKTKSKISSDEAVAVNSLIDKSKLKKVVKKVAPEKFLNKKSNSKQDAKNSLIKKASARPTSKKITTKKIHTKPLSKNSVTNVKSEKNDGKTKYIWKDSRDGLWAITNSKNGKPMRKAKTQKEAIYLAGAYKKVENIIVKKSSGWQSISGNDVLIANKTRLSANNKKVKGGK